MKKVSKRTIRLFVAGAFFLLTFFPFVSGGFAGEEKVVYGASYSPAVLRAGGEQLEEAEVVVELEEKFHQSQTYREIVQERAELIAENPDDLAEQLDALLTEQRAACQDFYAQQKAEFYQETGLDTSYFEDAIYSGFLVVNPERFVEQARPDLFVDRLAQSDSVYKVSVEAPATITYDGWFGSWEGETLPTVNGIGWDYYAGTGIKVGIIDEGRLDESFFESHYPDLQLINQNDTRPISDHSTRVGAIIAALAPKCTIYATVNSIGYNPENPNFFIDHSLNWLNDQNVQIVNCSFALEHKNAGSGYCRFESYYDNYAADNEMTLVFGSGNDGTTVNCPKEGRNIITVGATDNNGSTKAHYSNYGSQEGYVKPLLMANGAPHVPYQVDPFHLSFQYGTSFSAPMVTGALVKAAQKDYFIQYPVYAIPVLTSTATHENLSGGTFESNGIVNNYFGYGMLNIQNLMLNTATVMNPNTNNVHREDADSFDTETEQISTRILGAGTKIRASLFWMYGANLDLYVYGPNGNLITSSTSTTRRPEVVEFTAPTYGEYTLKMVREGSPVTSSSEVILFYAYLL